MFTTTTKNYLPDLLPRFFAFVAFALITLPTLGGEAPSPPGIQRDARTGGSLARPVVRYKTEEVEGHSVFYREAGPEDAPVVLLLHGFPSSSSMFRDLMPILADKYHVIAPDYPGFGASSMPKREDFSYTFDNLAAVMEKFVQKKSLTRFAVYVQDYGAPVGYRLFENAPDRVTAIIVQNGNAYDEGIDNDFWKPIKDYWANPTKENRETLRPFTKLEATRWQYMHGAVDPTRFSPDAVAIDQHYLDRPGNDEIQLDLFLSYGSNPPRYAKWQRLFRERQPPTLVVWGKNDQIFPPAGAEPYKRDLKDVEFHLLDAGHFALEERVDEIGGLIRSFLDRKVTGK